MKRIYGLIKGKYSFRISASEGISIFFEWHLKVESSEKTEEAIASCVKKKRIGIYVI